MRATQYKVQKVKNHKSWVHLSHDCFVFFKKDLAIQGSDEVGSMVQAMHAENAFPNGLIACHETPQSSQKPSLRQSTERLHVMGNDDLYARDCTAACARFPTSSRLKSLNLIHIYLKVLQVVRDIHFEELRCQKN